MIGDTDYDIGMANALACGSGSSAAACMSLGACCAPARRRCWTTSVRAGLAGATTMPRKYTP